MFRLEGPERGWIIQSVDNMDTPTLDDFINVVKSIPDRKRIPVTYSSIMDVHTINVAIVAIERHWSPFRLVTRNGSYSLKACLQKAPFIVFFSFVFLLLKKSNKRKLYRLWLSCFFSLPFWLLLDTTGLWDFTDFGDPIETYVPKPITASFAQLDPSLGIGKDLFRSLVKISFYIPCRLDGFPKSRVSLFSRSLSSSLVIFS